MNSPYHAKSTKKNSCTKQKCWKVLMHSIGNLWLRGNVIQCHPCPSYGGFQRYEHLCSLVISDVLANNVWQETDEHATIVHSCKLQVRWSTFLSAIVIELMSHALSPESGLLMCNWFGISMFSPRSERHVQKHWPCFDLSKIGHCYLVLLWLQHFLLQFYWMNSCYKTKTVFRCDIESVSE